MPRPPRQKSSTNIYHVMLRGINQQTIFEDEEDYIKFLETIKNYKAISGFKVYAYCLMSNHSHFLIKVEKEELDVIIKRIAGSYVYWYNWKYYRKGHLFQDRYKSEPVETDEYLFTVIRYIHQNPVKAGIANRIDNYKYSSYSSYIGESEFVDTDFPLSMMKKEAFINFNNEESKEKCLDVDNRDFRINDADAKKIIEKVSKCRSVAEFQMLNKEQRNKNIIKLRQKGLSIRQISRLTGVSKGIVENLK